MPAIYTNAKNLMLNPTGTLGATSTANVSWTGDTICAVMVDATTTGEAGKYAFDIGHTTLSTHVPTTARVGPDDGVVLTGKTVAGGIATAANTTFTGVTEGLPVDAVIIYKRTTTAAPHDGILIAYLDQGGFPFTPNGDVTLVWSTTDGIIKLP